MNDDSSCRRARIRPDAGGRRTRMAHAEHRSSLQEEKVDDHVGLSSAEAASRAQRFGPNKFDTGKAEPRWRAFIRQFADPMQIVLLVAGVVSLLLQEWETGIVQIPRITLGRVTILRNRSHKIWAPARNGPG